MVKESNNVFSIDRWRVQKRQARYYWNMTKCSTNDLAIKVGIGQPRAHKWVLQFIKERNKK